jgi:arylsulfatase A-like enzyme
MTFQQHCFIATVIFCPLFASATFVLAAQPNVIVIYSDDHGAVDLGCYGAKDVHTPHLDALAKSGTRFSQMYAPAPVCSASRAGLLSGKFPVRVGVPSNVSSKMGTPGMPTNVFTVAEFFKQSGYRTGHFGKWHIGYSPDTMPLQQGFDVSYGNMGGCIDNYSHFFYWNAPNVHDLWKNGVEIFEPGQYYPKRTTDECISFIEQDSEKPFFVYLAYNIPHYPLQPTPKWHEHYKTVSPEDVPFARPSDAEDDLKRRDALQHDPVTTRGNYAAFISSMDEQIGRVLESLDKSGKRENTIVLFQADQGHSFEARTNFGGGSAGQLRGGKFSLFEGGIRVPSIISWKNHIPVNHLCDQTAFACDWFPSLATLCSLKLPDNLNLDGKDITASLLENKPSPHESLFWMFDKQWAVRKGDWKLLGNPNDPSSLKKMPEKDRTLFLVNLKNDPGERHNLAEKETAILEKLLGLYEQYKTYISGE